MSGLAAPPQTVAHNLARAKSLLKRDETIRALESMIAGLDMYEPKKIMRKGQFEIEVLVQECVAELNRQPAVRKLFEALSPKAQRAAVPYTPKQEEKLKAMLNILLKGLNETIAAKERNSAEVKTKRKELLRQKGLDYLKTGDSPRGKAALKVLADEFGNEPGLITQVGAWLLEYKLYLDAAEILERAMERFPKDSKAYGFATQCYKFARDYEKQESVYLRAIRQFGKHPRTLLNLAKLYVDWNKRDKAYATAQEAYNKDRSLTEAKEIMDQCE
jgi:tetratricopeptide (TPR) repeat protein